MQTSHPLVFSYSSGDKTNPQKAMVEEDYPWQEVSSPLKRGSFIVIEGLDRAGKTTQVKKLCDVSKHDNQKHLC
jgi:ABC-type Mn2+/Zn2+ transport system ATPase subunit